MRDTQIRAEVVASKNLPQKPFPLSLSSSQKPKPMKHFCLSSDWKPDLCNRNENPGFMSFRSRIPNALATKLPFGQVSNI